MKKPRGGRADRGAERALCVGVGDERDKMHLKVAATFSNRHNWRDIRPLAKHLARGVDDYGTAFEADADGKLRRPNRSVSGVKLAEPLLDPKSGPNSAFDVVLLCAGIPERLSPFARRRTFPS